jgi:hypothetical protein
MDSDLRELVLSTVSAVRIELKDCLPVGSLALSTVRIELKD